MLELAWRLRAEGDLFVRTAGARELCAITLAKWETVSGQFGGYLNGPLLHHPAVVAGQVVRRTRKSVAVCYCLTPPHA
jgi:hypothetical protein